MKIIQADDVRSWYLESGGLAEFAHTIGRRTPDREYLETTLGMPVHLRFVVEKLGAERGRPIEADDLDSIPFYSLCRGLLLPLSFMESSRAAALFGIEVDEPPDAAAREALLDEFVGKDVGLSIEEKFGAIMGDPFLGRRSTFRRDSLLRLLLSLKMASRSELLDRLTQVGDVAVLFAESRGDLWTDLPLSAAEVLRTLRFLPKERLTNKFDILRSLMNRCGKLEAYFLAKLLLRKAGFGFDYQGPLLARVLGRQFGVAEEQVAHAMALTDVFHVAEVLVNEGADGLRRIQMQPLVPVKPALASGTTDEIETFPVWVERKYDGIRLMLHKSTGRRGSVLCGAYTRSRGDWLEQIPGLDATIKMLPAQSAILDGELYGTILDFDRARPASVYEVYAALQGQPSQPVNLKFAAFDLIYLNGTDLSGQPLGNRRRVLSTLVAPLASMPLAVPLSLSEGQLASHKDDVNRLYQHFRSQGYEGVITKDLSRPYCLAARDPSWHKRKPQITLDLVLLGATYAVTTKKTAGAFGSYVIGARNDSGGFDDVGDVAGVDRVRDAEIQAEIMREGLMTGRRIERPSSSGTRPGIELRPAIVVTIKFEGITRDQVTGKLSLRDPKIAMIRSDKTAPEADSTANIDEMYLRQRIG